MAFLDDEPQARPGERRARRAAPPERDRQIMTRRLVAVGVGILLLILIVLGVRGCLNARKERAFENYASDLTTLASDSKTVSKRLFDRLRDPGNLTPLEFEQEVRADRSAAEGLLNRAEGLDAPGDLSSAQGDIALAFELRRDGLAAISERIGAALGKEGSGKAIDSIAQQMRTFLASDVLYARGRDQINPELSGEGIEARVPKSDFLPDENEWLDPDAVRDALSGLSGSRAATPGVHGLGLIQTTLLPTGTVLQEGTTNTAAADGAELEVQVQNQGESEETDVTVSYSLQGGGSGEEQIPRIAAGQTETVNIRIQPAPSSGETAELTVRAEPVPGEEVEDNNEATYTVSFE